MEASAEGYRPDRVVRVLTFAVSVMYWGLWLAGVVVLVLLPAAGLIQEGDPLAGLDLTLPVNLTEPAVELQSAWGAPGAAPIEVEDATARLKIPARAAPGWFTAVSLVSLVAVLGLALLFFHHLRRVFQRVRDGAPFDAENARRLRLLGILLLAWQVVEAVTFFGLAAGAMQSLEGVGASFDLDAMPIFLALVLIALAEVFRRGAALEEDQSLVV